MKVKNIMFSGFAAAILMGVGAANAVVESPVTLADTGYVNAKVGQVVDAKLADYATTAQLEGYQQKLSGANAGDNIAISEVDGVVKIGASDVVKTGDMWTAADGVTAGANNADTDAYLNAAAAIDNKVPTVAAARQIAGVVLKSVDEVSGNLDTVQQQIGSYDAETGAGSGLLKDVADNKKAIEANKDSIDLLNGTDTEVGSVAHSIAAALKDGEGNAKYATKAEITEAGYATKTEAEGYATAAVDALNIEDYAKTAEVANTYATKDEITQAGYATKAEITEAGYATKTEAEGYATAAVDALNIEDYAKTADVNAGLAKKLDKTAIDEAAGTYMVTSDGAGNITYTKVRVATGVDGEGNATVTE